MSETIKQSGCVSCSSSQISFSSREYMSADLIFISRQIWITCCQGEMLRLLFTRKVIKIIVWNAEGVCSPFSAYEWASCLWLVKVWWMWGCVLFVWVQSLQTLCATAQLSPVCRLVQQLITCLQPQVCQCGRVPRAALIWVQPCADCTLHLVYLSHFSCSQSHFFSISVSSQPLFPLTSHQHHHLVHLSLLGCLFPSSVPDLFIHSTPPHHAPFNVGNLLCWQPTLSPLLSLYESSEQKSVVFYFLLMVDVCTVRKYLTSKYERMKKLCSVSRNKYFVWLILKAPYFSVFYLKCWFMTK